MFCQIYKSLRKPDAYVYLPLNGDTEELPIEMTAVLSPFEPVMSLDLSKREKLARADVAEVIAGIEERGFYLQMPPPPGADDDFKPF